MSASNYVGLPHRGAWLVYLNGIEVPCPSVTVNYGVWTIPEATLSFPPHRLLQRLGAEDRLEVAVFYLDDLIDPGKPQFRLLFDGEILGWSYTTSASGRQMSFNAVADISIFTQLYFFFLNNVDAIADYAIASGAQATGVAQPGAFYPFSLFKKGLIVPPKEEGKEREPDVTRPYEIIYNATRGMVDSQLNDSQPIRRAIPSVNFFSRWVRKRNFINRFFALPSFEEGDNPTAGVFPILQAAQATTAMQAIQQRAGTISNAGTMWEVLKEVFSTVNCEIAMLPTAPSARVRLSDGVVLRPGDQDATDIKNAATEPVRLMNYFVKPQFFFGIAPTCNVMFPSMHTNYSYAENYIVQPTRTYVNDQFISSTLASSTFVAAALSFGYPQEVDVVLGQKTGRALAAAEAARMQPNLGKINFSGKNVLVYPEEFFKGPVVSRGAVPAWFTYLVNRQPTPIPLASGNAPPEPATLEEQKSLHALMASYVEYEHFRNRYEKRGGAVNMAWNPYVVPGFPCVIFDQKASSFHTVGYLSNVVQTLSLSGMDTAINYTLSRTVPEMFDLLQNDILKEKDKTGKDQVWGNAPLEPITSIRDVVQDFDKAEQFYNALFFQRQPMKNGKKASFDFREVVGYDNGDGSVSPINLTVQTIDTWVDAGAPHETTQLITELDGTADIAPLPGFVPVFKQYDTAMQYVARPICTLDEYVSFLHGGEADVTELKNLNPPELEDGDDRFSGVKYYKRIKRLTFNPDYVPSSAEMGVVITDPAGAYVFDETPVGAVEASQVRADWDSTLVKYQVEMYSRMGPQE